MHIVCTVGLIQYWYKGIHTLMLRGLRKRSMCVIKLHEQFSAESLPLKEQQCRNKAGWGNILYCTH